jgi:hypothetical protein
MVTRGLSSFLKTPKRRLLLIRPAENNLLYRLIPLNHLLHPRRAALRLGAGTQLRESQLTQRAPKRLQLAI